MIGAKYALSKRSAIPAAGPSRKNFTFVSPVVAGMVTVPDSQVHPALEAVPVAMVKKRAPLLSSTSSVSFTVSAVALSVVTQPAPAYMRPLSILPISDCSTPCHVAVRLPTAPAPVPVCDNGEEVTVVVP